MIDWSKQHCGVHQAPIQELVKLMPDILPALKNFPDRESNFTWDVKVHMLIPRQFPCIPGWHVDNIPREGGVQKFDKGQYDLPMYCWVSGPPLTQFMNGYVLPEVWHKFTQSDLHRGNCANSFCWRGFIRATHKKHTSSEREWRLPASALFRIRAGRELPVVTLLNVASRHTCDMLAAGSTDTCP